MVRGWVGSVVLAVWAGAACGCGARGDAASGQPPPSVTPDAPGVEAPAPDQPPPPPGPPAPETPQPAETTVSLERVRREGACGTAELTHLLPQTPQSTEHLVRASPHGRILVLHDRSKGRGRFLAPHSGRSVEASGTLLAWLRDETRALLWRERYRESGPYDTRATGLGRLLEVEPSTGTVRDVMGADEVRVPHLVDAEGFALLTAADGRTWRYALHTGAVDPLTRPRETHGWWRSGGTYRAGSPYRLLVQEGGGLVLLEPATLRRWELGAASHATLLEDGVGVVLVDAAGRAWGWTPAHGRVALGAGGPSSYQFAPNAVSVQGLPAASGGVLHVGPDGKASLWNVRTGDVMHLDEGVATGALSPDGTRVALGVRRDGASALVVRDLPSGQTRTLLQLPRGAPAPGLRWDGTGTRLLSFSQPGTGPVDDPYARVEVHLWNVLTARSTFLTSYSTGGWTWSGSFFFAADDRLVHASNQGDTSSVFSAEDGAHLYSTLRTSLPGEGDHFGWGPGGIFYGYAGGRSASSRPDLFAWNPHTGEETELGHAASTVCFVGTRHVFHRDLDTYEDVTAPLVAWTPETRAFTTLSPEATHPWCLPGRPALAFLEDYRQRTDLRWEGRLTFADVERGCHQPLVDGVLRVHRADDGAVVERADGLWHVAFPPAPAP